MNRETDPMVTCDVVLVDPDRLFREALSGILSRNGFSVVASAATTKELEEAGMPDWSTSDRQRLFVIDIAESVDELRDRLPRLVAAAEVKVVGVSRSMAAEKLYLALELGFHACLTKDISFESFQKYVRLVLSGESVFPVGLAQALLNAPKRPPSVGRNEGASYSLTNREYVILGYLTQGASNKVIARHIGVSDATVKVNVKTLFRKLDVSNRTEAAAWAVQRGIRPADVQPAAPQDAATWRSDLTVDPPRNAIAI